MKNSNVFLIAGTRFCIVRIVQPGAFVHKPQSKSRISPPEAPVPQNPLKYWQLYHNCLHLSAFVVAEKTQCFYFPIIKVVNRLPQNNKVRSKMLIRSRTKPKHQSESDSGRWECCGPPFVAAQRDFQFETRAERRGWSGGRGRRAGRLCLIMFMRGVIIAF